MKHLFCILVIAIAATADDLKSPAILLKEGNDQFTARLLSEVSKQHSGESVVLSGISVLFPLASLSLASTGVTHDEILTVMGLPNDNVTKEAFSGFQQNFKSSKGITLDLANKIFVAENYELNDEFAKLSKDVFDTEVQNIDFAQSSKSASIINKWVENHTNNKIKDLISPDTLDSDTKSVLVNAIYFKGNWKEKFLEEDTKPRDFYVSKVKKVQVPMMYRKGDYLYGESKELNAQLLEIPYENDEASFMVILPNDVEGLPELQRKLSNKTLLRNAESHMYSTEVSLYLPKFKIETTTNLLRALENMNVKSLFSNEAGITNLLKSKLPLSVTSAVQKAFIEINEEGTEAAAGSAFGVQYLSAIISKTPTFKADHPFIFFLKEGENVVFTGLYNS